MKVIFNPDENLVKQIQEGLEKKDGYCPCKIFKTPEKLLKAYKELYENQVIPEIIKNGLSATVYTELTDIEDEMNGILTFDRVLKIDKDELIKLNEKVYNSFNKKFN